MSKVLHAGLKLGTVIFALIGLVLTGGYVAVRMGLTKTSGTIDVQSEKFLEIPATDKGAVYASFPLAHTPEWIAFRIAVTKDRDMINKISKQTGVPSRLLIALLVPEQMRLFYSNRPLFKEIFSPLKILGSQSQFSWGIFGIKDDTARAVETHLTDISSPYYLGASFEHMLDFTTADIDQERFTRIVDEHDHTYSYLYTALYIDQIEAQWNKAHFPINGKSDILATLWNLGFEKSIPNAHPQAGGSMIDISGTRYSFGILAKSFYDSDEMIEIFPKIEPRH